MILQNGNPPAPGRILTTFPTNHPASKSLRKVYPTSPMLTSELGRRDLEPFVDMVNKRLDFLNVGTTWWDVDRRHEEPVATTSDGIKKEKNVALFCM